jgi:hypothetical protein
VAGLAPQGCFIAAEAIEREVGQIGETQKATREIGSGINGFRPELGRASERGYGDIGNLDHF